MLAISASDSHDILYQTNSSIFNGLMTDTHMEELALC